MRLSQSFGHMHLVDHDVDGDGTPGCRRVDIGQTGAESWTVLADREGNEFCVVRPKKTLIR
jgi:hypothetical protein